jgi:hypothetical protein
LSNLRDADIADADYIHAVCTLDIPIDDPENQIADAGMGELKTLASTPVSLTRGSTG